jgi:hypothetical protein
MRDKVFFMPTESTTLSVLRTISTYYRVT